MDKIQERQFAKLEYVDPESLWLGNQPIATNILQKHESVRLLTSAQRKTHLEIHHAACLAMMMQNRFGKISVCVKEAEDFDCVLRGVDPAGKMVYRPVQLKQLPSHQFKDDAEIQPEIDKLTKYGCGLAVSFWVDRDIKFEVGKLRLDRLRIEQLWFLGGSCSNDWFIYGGTIPQLLSGKLLEGILKGGRLPMHRRERFFTPSQP